MSEKEKIEILMQIVEKAIYELKKSSESWFGDRVYDLIGTSEEELRKLGFKIVP